MEIIDGLKFVNVGRAFPLWVVIPQPLDEVFEAVISDPRVKDSFNVVLRFIVNVNR